MRWPACHATRLALAGAAAGRPLDEVGERAAGQVRRIELLARGVREASRARRRRDTAIADGRGRECVEHQDAIECRRQAQLHGQVHVIGSPGKTGDIRRPVVGLRAGLGGHDDRVLPPGDQVPHHELEDVPVIRADHVGDGAAVRADGVAGGPGLDQLRRAPGDAHPPDRRTGERGGRFPDEINPAVAHAQRRVGGSVRLRGKPAQQIAGPGGQQGQPIARTGTRLRRDERQRCRERGRNRAGCPGARARGRGDRIRGGGPGGWRSAGAPGRRRGDRHGCGGRRAPEGVPAEPHILMTAGRTSALLSRRTRQPPPADSGRACRACRERPRRAARTLYKTAWPGGTTGAAGPAPSLRHIARRSWSGTYRAGEPRKCGAQFTKPVNSR